MIKGIRNKEFHFHLECCLAELKSYPGATAKELKHNIQFFVQIDPADTVVIMVDATILAPGRIKKILRRKKLRRKLLILAHIVAVKVYIKLLYPV